MSYVVHFCRNKKCNNAWIDRDMTNATSTPPKWKYCEACSEKLRINYDIQTPVSNLSERELKHKKELSERLKRNRIKKRSER